MANMMAPKQSMAVDKADNMSNRIEVIRCPQCNSPFEATRLDSPHPSHSLDKPLKSNAGKAIVKGYVCRNPKCEAKITVYWYDQTLFLNRL